MLFHSNSICHEIANTTLAPPPTAAKGGYKTKWNYGPAPTTLASLQSSHKKRRDVFSRLFWLWSLLVKYGDSNLIFDKILKFSEKLISKTNFD